MHTHRDVYLAILRALEDKPDFVTEIAVRVVPWSDGYIDPTFEVDARWRSGNHRLGEMHMLPSHVCPDHAEIEIRGWLRSLPEPPKPKHPAPLPG